MWPFIFKDYKSLALKDDIQAAIEYAKENPDPEKVTFWYRFYPWHGKSFAFLPKGADTWDEFDGDVNQMFTFIASSCAIVALGLYSVRRMYVYFRTYRGLFFSPLGQKVDRALFGTPKDYF